uniref:BRCT domain-containing protein n=1 Tax=Haemonchus contortus TaxID=6289 RepID=A0A7I4Z6S1_HAECO
MLSEQVERKEMRGCEDVPMDSSRCSDVEADTDMQAEHEKHKRIIAVLKAAKSLEEFGGHQIAVPEWLAQAGEQEKVSPQELQHFVEEDLRIARICGMKQRQEAFEGSK